MDSVSRFCVCIDNKEGFMFFNALDGRVLLSGVSLIDTTKAKRLQDGVVLIKQIVGDRQC
jgi:hypothetical protein